MAFSSGIVKLGENNEGPKKKAPSLFERVPTVRRFG
jgi:hypothetical protein